jgi:preprotein translocase subunit SecA
MITKSIERAQKKVEENNFGTRKRLLEYDDVMNSQREVIYKKRRHALFGDRLSVDISNMLYDLGEAMLAQHQESRDYEGIRMDVIRNMGIEPPFSEDSFLNTGIEHLNDLLFEKATVVYREKSRRIGEKTMPVILDVFEKQKQYENIAIPITDGQKGMQVVVNLKRAVENGYREVILSIEKNITLALIDESWKEHLRELDELKQSVQNATYEQKDPLLIYKFESFNLFKTMVNKINKDVISFLMRADIPVQDHTQVREAQRPRGLDRSKMKEERSDLLSQAHSNTQHQEVTQPIVAEKKVGRNEPCPCGSGKKYKNCHGKVAIDG